MGVNLAKTARDNYFVLGDYCSKDWGSSSPEIMFLTARPEM